MYVGLAVAYVGEAGLLHQLFPLLLLPLTIGYLDRVVIPLEEKKLRVWREVRELFGQSSPMALIVARCGGDVDATSRLCDA